MKKHIHAIIFGILVGILISYLHFTFAAYNPASSTIAIPGSSGQVLYNNAGSLGAIPNAYATTSPNGKFEINVGQYSGYPNPSGMYNVYDESTSSPILSASFMGSTTDNYVQLFGQNLARGGTFDFIAADDMGSATSTGHYLDLGIANTAQVDAEHTLISPLDGYLFNESSRLLIGTAGNTASSTVVIAPTMSTSTYTRWDQFGHLITHGSSSGALSGCGTSPSSAGNDFNGVITLGAGLSVTACTKAFANAYPAGSTVSCSISTNSTLIQPALTSVSTTGFSISLSLSLAAGKVYYQCQASE